MIDRIPYLRKNKKTGKYEPVRFIDEKGKEHSYLDVPEAISCLITKFVCKGDFHHERSFDVPLHPTDDEYMRGTRHNWLKSRQGVALNFIDGNPRSLEIAMCSRWGIDYKRDNERATQIDAITIDTRTFSQTIEKEKENCRLSRHSRFDNQTSYAQRGIGESEDLTPCPLMKQLNFIDRNYFAYWQWFYKKNPKSCPTNGYYDNVFIEEIRRLQRNLARGRVKWVFPHEEYVGIYEKVSHGMMKVLPLNILILILLNKIRRVTPSI